MKMAPTARGSAEVEDCSRDAPLMVPWSPQTSALLRHDPAEGLRRNVSRPRTRPVVTVAMLTMPTRWVGRLQAVSLDHELRHDTM